MGCGASAPKAEVYLANKQPAPANGYLHEMPTDGLTMQAWSNFDPGPRWTAGSGALGALTTMSVAVDQFENGHLGGGSSMGDGVGHGGVGKAEALAITASGAQIGTMYMPPHMAFGIAGCLRDAAGQTIAVIATKQSQRPRGMSSSSVNVWGAKPIAGQAATAIGGIAGYLWARAERKPFSNTFTIYDAADQPIAKGIPIRGWAEQYKFETMGGQGLMLATFTPGSNKKSFDIQVAKGVDVTLAICMMAAMQIGKDELHVDPQQAHNNDD